MAFSGFRTKTSEHQNAQILMVFRIQKGCKKDEKTPETNGVWRPKIANPRLQDHRILRGIRVSVVHRDGPKIAKKSPETEWVWRFPAGTSRPPKSVDTDGVSRSNNTEQLRKSSQKITGN